MKFKVEIIQGKELAEKFAKAGKTVTDKIDKALFKAGLVVERSAKQIVPVDTGRLRASIATRLVPGNAEVGTRVEYAKFVEFGTNRQRPQPYLQPALINNQDQIKLILHTGLVDAMQDIFKKGFTKIL
jgi:HK97 gp10 family phage protein